MGILGTDSQVNPSSMARLFIGALILVVPSPAMAEIPGHRYVWADVPYVEQIPAKISGGETKCSTDYYGNVNCYTSPTYVTPPTTRNFFLRVHIDCTEKTYDAKGDGKGWQSWMADAGVSRIASRQCARGLWFPSL